MLDFGKTKWLSVLAGVALFALIACQPLEPSAITPIPIVGVSTPTAAVITCADLDAAWSNTDWQTALNVIDRLQAGNITCGIEALESKRYAVLINLGNQLQVQGETAQAVVNYRAALALNGQRLEALKALSSLKALPPPTPAPCALAPLASYHPVGNVGFVQAQGSQLVVDGKSFLVQGVNYYPRNAPWQGFIAGSDLNEIKDELDRIAARGFNSIRIFLWYDALFQCAPERAVPNTEAFEKLDAIIRLAAERNLRPIVTLNDLPDFYFRPIYTDWARYDAQTAFIVNRYRDEPMILAWDVRNEGDIDYGATGNPMPNTTQPQVLDWLKHITALVRRNDPHHLVTAGWLEEGIETADDVDVVSLHHWSSADGLADRIAELQAETSKPLLVEEMGVSTLGTDGQPQAQALPGMIHAAESNRTAGWMIWTAFDFFALPDSMSGPELRFGLWRNDLSPKPAVNRLPIPTRNP